MAPRRLSAARRCAGEIRIGDRNYARVPVLKRFLAEASGKADFIVRVGWNALQLSTPRGKPFDLIGYLQRLPAGMRPHEVSLHAAAGRGEAALPLRLIVQRKTPEAAEATRLALRRAAIKKGKKLDPRSLIAAEFMILATSLPKKGYSGERYPRGLPPALADRTRVQTPEIAAAYRPAANAD